MKLSTVQDQAIAARMALVVGATTFDRLFADVQFQEVDGDLLYVFAKDEEAAAEIEDRFSLHISIIATGILKHEIGIVLVLPKQLARQATHVQSLLDHDEPGRDHRAVPRRQPLRRQPATDSRRVSRLSC